MQNNSRWLRGSGGSGPLNDNMSNESCSHSSHITIKLMDVRTQNFLDVRSDNRFRSAILLIGARAAVRSGSPWIAQINRWLDHMSQPEYKMLNQMMDCKNETGTVVIAYQGRYIAVSGVDRVDIENIDDICAPMSVESARDQADLYDIVFGSVGQSDQEVVSRDEIDADVDARFGLLDLDDQEALIENLDQDVNVFDIPMFERTIDESISSSLEQLVDIGLIKEVDPTCELDQAQYKLTLVGRVLKELAFGSDHMATVRANRGVDA